MSFEKRKVRVGTVVSDKMDKTVIVQFEWHHRHRLYRKSIKRRTRFKAHDGENRCEVGDVVRIVETRPLSKTKRWRVDEVLAHEESTTVEAEPELEVMQEEVVGIERTESEEVPQEAEHSEVDEASEVTETSKEVEATEGVVQDEEMAPETAGMEDEEKKGQ